MRSLEKTSLSGQLMRLSLPIMAGNLLQTLYNMADTFFLGKLGKEAISAPSITMNISNFIIVFGAAFSIAGTTMISQVYGADRNNRERIDSLASQVFLVNFTMSIAVTVFGVAMTKPLLLLMQVPSGLTFDYTVQYMTITFFTMPLLFGDFVLRTTLQGIGDSLTPLYVQTTAVVLNVALDPLFIFGWGPIPAMEVEGAAWATLLARSVSCTVSMLLLFGGYRGVRVRLPLMRPEKRVISLLVRIGLPSSIGQSVSSLGFAVLQGVVNSFGPAVIAAFGVGNRIQSVFHMPARGISQGVSILTGKKLGAGDIEGASSVAWRGLLISGIFVGVGMTLVLLFGEQVITFFVNDPEVIEHGVRMFKYTAPMVVCFALYTAVLGAFQGGGKTRPVMVMNIVRLWGLRVPLAYVLPLLFGIGVHGLWLAMLASNVVVAIWSIWLFSRGSWRVTLDI
jgi:putative MATE family efflux protein